jgi:hypothetical protein
MGEPMCFLARQFKQFHALCEFLGFHGGVDLGYDAASLGIWFLTF